MSLSFCLFRLAVWSAYTFSVSLTFDGPIFYWKGPAPHSFVRVPPEQAEVLREAARLVSYGWGMLPVQVRIGASEWPTALFPKDGSYLVPIRASIRRAERLEEGDLVRVVLEVRG